MNLFKHQKDWLNLRKDKDALVWSCGTGKSLTALLWSKLSSGDTLVICPKPLKLNWHNEAKKWDIPVTVVTKEEFRKFHKVARKYEQVIVDEVHNGFLTPHFKSQMSKALRWYLKQHDIKRLLLLSATIYSSSPWNIWNLAYYLGYKWDWQKFNFTFFNQIRMGRRIIPVVKKGSEAKLATIVKKIASVVDIHDCMDVPPQIHTEPEIFELSNEQKKAIEENYDPLPIVRFTKQHEIEQGILKGSFRTLKNDKTERILSLCEENPKIAIVCRYNDQIDYLVGLLAHYKPSIIRGDVKNRHEVCVEAEKAERAVVLIQADSVEGYQLPSFGVCVFASMSYSYVKFEQVCGRFLRMDKPSKTVFIYLLTAGDSIDRAVYESIKRKEDFSIALYNK